MTFLLNEIMQLRALEPEDLRLMHRWENDSELWKYSCTVEPYSLFQIKKYIASEGTIYDKRELRLMVELKNAKKTVVGCVDLCNFDAHHRRAEVCLLIDSQFLGKGYANQALQLLENYAFNFLHLKQMYAYVSVENEHCLQLFKKNGFQKSGVLQSWQRTENGFEDVVIFQKIAEK